MSNKRPTEEAYTELQEAYDFYNAELFGGQLPACLITFQRQKSTLGYFSRKRFGHRDGRTTDELAMNPEYFAVVPMIEVLQTVVHEQTHLWQEHFGKPSRACYHNTQWADKMEAIGLMPSHTGRPGGKRVGQSMGDYVIAGGHFDIATRKLLATGFEISWLDRFPAQRPQRYTPLPEPSPSFSAAEASVSGLSEALEDTEGEISPEAEGAAWVPPSTLQPDLIEEVKQGNRSNRNKYSCPDCALNVWGKPGLRIMCADHQRLLVEEVPA